MNEQPPFESILTGVLYFKRDFWVALIISVGKNILFSYKVSHRIIDVECE